MNIKFNKHELLLSIFNKWLYIFVTIWQSPIKYVPWARMCYVAAKTTKLVKNWIKKLSLASQNNFCNIKTIIKPWATFFGFQEESTSSYKHNFTNTSWLLQPISFSNQFEQKNTRNNHSGLMRSVTEDRPSENK